MPVVISPQVALMPFNPSKHMLAFKPWLVLQPSGDRALARYQIWKVVTQ